MGRADELALIDSLLADQDRSGYGPMGRGLLLRGDPGVGKTALLDIAVARGSAAGWRVLRACGVEFEAGISFATIHQMLYPLRADVDRLPGLQRDVLHRLFELTPEALPDPLTAGTAVLALLDAAAAESPLLLVADDAPWIDPASATVLAFAVRRLAHAPVVLLAAGRTGLEGLLHHVGLPERMVRPLDDQSASELLEVRWPGLAPTVRRRLLAQAAGSPLALQELPATLNDRQRFGAQPLPSVLPLSERLLDIFAPGLDQLPGTTRKALLLAALAADDGLGTIRAAARGFLDPDDLVPAQRAGMVRADAASGQVTFSHPLTRSAVAYLALPGERRAAHQALADALAFDPERQACHLAEASTGPDEAVARALDKAALLARRRGRASTAVATLVRAGELSPHPGDRSRRLVEAAHLATMAGRLDQVTWLLADAGQTPETPDALVFTATAHLLTNNEGDVTAAYRLLTRALDSSEDAGPDSWDRYGILYALLLVSLYTLRPQPWELLRKTMARFEPEQVVSFRLCYDAYVDPTRTSDSIRQGLARAFAALPPAAAPWEVIPLAFAALAMDILSEYRYVVRGMIERERDGGAIAMVVPGLMLLCQDSYVHGQWDEAEELALQGLELATRYGYSFWERQIRAVLSSGAALRGDVDLARSRSKETTTWAAPRGMSATMAYALSARHLAAMGQGDFEEAHTQVAQIDLPTAPSAGIPNRWVVLDLVEAAMRTGRREEARAHVVAAQRAGLHRIGTRMALITAAAAAVAADDDEAAALFEAALALPEVARYPWEQARIQFAYGQWLRRTRDTAHARIQLRAAMETFDRIGARAMVQRARNELRATGVAAAGRSDTAAPELTAQERQIADLAATGLTNKEIGARLFLSPRTVGSHLHRLFPKLGITTRAALRAALEARYPEAHSGGEFQS
ncbi:AAA family ATPase [Streptomyces spinoverrucosus]|uniref:helix-turn-helix transcriptional regulator n=1 Tax=Streptomyces spinoverrucosus TaxID=284043 RepID=UPI0018C36805|nr:LuxR family transcriptional regulator [Streptomyces spinoverrucosus]MBG0850354.1 AAA family ATPase [Streptomyces spinoverrucosus]